MTAQFNGCEPIICAHLLRQVDGNLIELLRSLTPIEWDVQTVAPGWKVRDVAAHLLDTALRKVSMVRDSWYVETTEIRSPDDLAKLVNRLNAEGVAVFRRLSPSVLIGMMEIACDQSASLHESLDPFAPATFGVSWAGEATSLNWFDTARELTERWHHQQQIREATNRPGIMTPAFYHPVLDCFLRGLPYIYRDVEADDGTTLLVEISGDCGGCWYLSKRRRNWKFVNHPLQPLSASIAIPQKIAWRVFTKGIDCESAEEQIKLEGNRSLAERVLELTAIVA
jgi:uncharacterized protein (TIGR03083 family)